ncbi:alpha/beta fold hydrolase [Microbacterium sp. Bi128]|uniref:alpha/beta fold hydrolase n=1 Tax=Microbacterium sp. Bi128 TaxID=2821115 RepID=UPI001DC2A324|nr:alpha/beta hydrolase [Microbacterium sp. Bi128]CAH0248023.1 2-hydroxy-6-oxononadienedioate/2-hydroxy-6-oxononatrienedioate hydrolase [Microbacterium sp. Bi128]
MRTTIADLDVHTSATDVAGRDVLLWHHGSPQTGAILPPVRAAADARGLAVVSVARPAYAGSSRIPGRSVADVAEGLRPVLERLGVASVVSVGASGGGPHAIACAAAMPGLVRRVVTFASPAPFVDDDAWFAGMQAPEALRAATQGEDARRRFAEIDEFDPDSFVDADYAALDGEWTSLGASVAASEPYGIDGLIDDDLAFARPWGFALAEVVASVLLVQGEKDRVIPPQHARMLAAGLPHARLDLHPDDGHVSALRHLAAALGSS